MNGERLLQRFFQYITCAGESFHEKDFCLMMEDELRTLGLAVQRQEIGEMIGSNGWNIHTLLPGSGAPLLCCVHLDTAAPGMGIVPTVHEGVIYSESSTVLGADGKAAIAVIMEVMQTLTEHPRPHRPVELLLTLCGESGHLGARFADYQQIVSKEAVVWEGEAMGHITRCAPCRARYHLEILGESAHASAYPEKGIHALQAAADCVAQLRCGCFSSGRMVSVANFLCLGQTNVIPEKASFDMELCAPGKKALQALTEEVMQTIGTVCGRWGAQFRSRKSSGTPGLCTPEDIPLIARTCRAMEALGIRPVIGCSLRSGEAVQLAGKGLEVIGIGIGAQDTHCSAEHILFQDMVSATELLLELLTEA